MKIFYIDPQSYNNLADYDKYLLENINNEISFFCSEKFPFNKIKNVIIKKNYFYSKYKGIKKTFSYCVSQFVLIRSIKKEKPDVVHFQWFKIPIFDYYILKIIKLFSKKTKIIYTAHNVLPHDSGTKYLRIYNRIYRFVDKIIVHANVTKQEIVNQFNINKSKLEIIPHGFLPVKSKSLCNKKKDILTFSFIGFLSEYKGLDVLLDAWINNEEIINSNKIELIIAGAGNLDCLNKIPKKKNIVLENYFHTEQDLSQVIANTDVAILPYKKISQSGVLLTYLAEKVPVIVSNIGGLTQPFEIGKVGWVLDEITSCAIQEVLLQIISNPEKLLEIKNDKDLWDKISNFYNWKNIGKKTYDMYRSL